MKRILFLLSVTALSLALFSCTPKKAPFAPGEFKQWAQTPPMGWNSWDCYGPTVVESEVKANADYMAENLKQYGWEYVVVDIRWFVENDKAGGYNQDDPRYVLDEWGRYQPAVNRFPSAEGGKGFKPIADYVHSKGLKFGIHIMRGIAKEAVANKCPIKGTKGITADQIASDRQLCRWLRDNKTVEADSLGAQEYYNSLFDLYASWGVDFVKIDDMSIPYHQDEIEQVRNAIDQCGRPIVLSLSPGPTPVSSAEHVKEHANMWRMVNDVWDIWRDVTHLMSVAERWYDYIAPGTWPDCDMIPLGHIAIRGERGEDRMTRLTPDEQYSLMSFFTIVKSPLMFGGDLPTMDPFTLSLLTNEDVLRMHRCGTEVHPLLHEPTRLVVTSRDAEDGSVYLALFNIGDENDEDFELDFASLGIEGEVTVKDLWQGSSEAVENIYKAVLAPHACRLVRFGK